VCGIAGVYEVEGAQYLAQEILFAIQHRGQESCGIAIRNPQGNVVSHKGMGLVKNVLEDDVLAMLVGRSAIGHVRYPTAGSSDIANAQPHAIDLAEGPHMAISSNGDIVNYGQLRGRLERENGFTFKSDNDAELIGRLIAYYNIVRGEPIEDAIRRAVLELKGAFSTLLIYKDRMFAFRDPHGYRPFVMGHLSHDGQGPIPSEGTVFSSECSGFGIVGANRVREVGPGEVVRLERGKPVTTVSSDPSRRQHCVFELIYFSRPDSEAFGEHVYDFREKIGAVLARQDEAIEPGEDLVVMPVPDSSNFVALGYAREKKAAFGMGLLRNHYVGRTFIRPNQKLRDEGVRQKFNPLPGYFPGRRVVLVDDSIVRGTSLRKIVRMLKNAGAKEIHVRIGSPRVVGPCPYGIDTPTEEELIANRLTVEGISQFLNADSLRYMELGQFDQILATRSEYCFACFDRNYLHRLEDFGAKSNAPADRC